MGRGDSGIETSKKKKKRKEKNERKSVLLSVAMSTEHTTIATTQRGRCKHGKEGLNSGESRRNKKKGELSKALAGREEEEEE